MKLHNRFSDLDARALQSGMQIFCMFFRAGGHFCSSPLIGKKKYQIYLDFSSSKIIISIGGGGLGARKGFV